MSKSKRNENIEDRKKRLAKLLKDNIARRKKKKSCLENAGASGG
ncbi:MAG: hypothetical protein AB8U44_01115 [Aaplasma endosymbiont of Hyalomma asiaticum]